MLSVLPAHYEQSVQKCYPSLYFSNKKSTDFNVFFRTQILKKFDTNLRTLPVKVAALPCEVRNWFTRSKRYCPPPQKKKLTTLNTVSSYIQAAVFGHAVSQKLLKLTSDNRLH